MNPIEVQTLWPKAPWPEENQVPLGDELASLNRRSENVIVELIIVPELELRNVKMQIFLVYFVEGADDPALEDAPESLDRVGVDRANNVFLPRMANSEVAVAGLLAV